MEIDGKYNIELATTMGQQPLELILMTSGNFLSGVIDGHFGRHDFSGGSVSGKQIGFSVQLLSPVGAMELVVNAAIDGDEISGQVQLGDFRPTPFKGTRV